MNINLETKRLILRKFHVDDSKDCLEYLSDRGTCYMDGGYEPFIEDERFYRLMSQYENQLGRIMIVLKEENKVIGTLFIRESIFRVVKGVEVAYCINPRYRRCGYASEAIQAILNYLFKMTDIQIVTAKAYEHNNASIHLLEKLGFKFEGKLHKAFQYPNKQSEDLVCYYYDKEDLCI